MASMGDITVRVHVEKEEAALVLDVLRMLGRYLEDVGVTLSDEDRAMADFAVRTLMGV